MVVETPTALSTALIGCETNHEKAQTWSAWALIMTTSQTSADWIVGA